MARRHLTSFIEYVQPDTVPARHHRLLIEKLEAVERGEITRLMVFMPPGSAKSTYASILFPAWFLGRNPGKSLIGSSHTAELAERFGRKVRNLVGGAEWHSVFSHGISSDSAAAGRWETEAGAEYYAVGVGGAILGRRADGGILDDPVKGRSEADSETQRESLWQWYKSDFWTRLKPGAWIILIMQRWHEDDIAGRLLADAEKGGERWDVLKLPALAGPDDPLGRDPGEQLWPEWFRPEDLAIARRDARNWSALYQQEPSPEEGTFFLRQWFKLYDPYKPPSQLNVYAASDYAVTEGSGDFTEHGIFGTTHTDDLYALDWWSGQTTADEWIERQLDLVKKHKPLAWFGEAGVIRGAIEPFLRKRMQERKTFTRMEWVPSTRDKPTRARAFQARAAQGKVYLPDNDWGHRLLDQLLRFPAGANDDAVDVCGLIGRVIDDMHPAIVKADGTKGQEDRWKAAFRRNNVPSGDWRTV